MEKDSAFCDEAAMYKWDSVKDASDIQVKVKYGCDCITHTMETYFMDPGLRSNWFVYALMIASMLFDVVSFLYIYSSKGLQAHPMKFFMWISFANYSFFWILLWQNCFC